MHPFAHIAVAFTGVASPTEELQVGRITRSALRRGYDMIDLQLFMLVTACALALLFLVHGLNVGLGKEATIGLLSSPMALSAYNLLAAPSGWVFGLHPNDGSIVDGLSALRIALAIAFVVCLLGVWVALPVRFSPSRAESRVFDHKSVVPILLANDAQSRASAPLSRMAVFAWLRSGVEFLAGRLRSLSLWVRTHCLPSTFAVHDSNPIR